jgi:hypothetical protein
VFSSHIFANRRFVVDSDTFISNHNQAPVHNRRPAAYYDDDEGSDMGGFIVDEESGDEVRELCLYL